MRSYSTQAIIKPKKDSSKRGWKICSVWRRFWAPPLMPHGMEQPLGNSHLWAPAWREKQKSGLCMQPLACQTAYRSKFPWIGFWCSILFLLLDHVSWFLCMSSPLHVNSKGSFQWLIKASSKQFQSVPLKGLSYEYLRIHFFCRNHVLPIIK